jgi:hypothetical protein
MKASILENNYLWLPILLVARGPTVQDLLSGVGRGGQIYTYYVCTYVCKNKNRDRNFRSIVLIPHH